MVGVGEKGELAALAAISLSKPNILQLWEEPDKIYKTCGDALHSFTTLVVAIVKADQEFLRHVAHLAYL